MVIIDSLIGLHTAYTTVVKLLDLSFSLTDLCVATLTIILRENVADNKCLASIIPMLGRNPLRGTQIFEDIKREFYAILKIIFWHMPTFCCR